MEDRPNKPPSASGPAVRRWPKVEAPAPQPNREKAPPREVHTKPVAPPVIKREGPSMKDLGLSRGVNLPKPAQEPVNIGVS